MTPGLNFGSGAFYEAAAAIESQMYWVETIRGRLHNDKDSIPIVGCRLKDQVESEYNELVHYGDQASAEIQELVARLRNKAQQLETQEQDYVVALQRWESLPPAERILQPEPVHPGRDFEWVDGAPLS